MRRVAAVLAAIAFLLAPIATAAHAGEPRHEQLQVGPYRIDVGFSNWPVLAEQSVDITFEPVPSPFEPDAGIANKSGTFRLIQPDGEEYWSNRLPRHPRYRDVWGLDLIALPYAGDWAIELAIEGPLGSGVGRLGPVPVGERPGPPAAPMWLIGVLPLGFLGWMVVGGWRRVRPMSRPEARSWV